MSKIRFNAAFESADAYKASATAPNITLDLAGNEGAGPDPELVASTLAEWGKRVRRYPSTAALTDALAHRLDITPAQILVTNGGDDAIDRTCRIMLAPGRNAVVQRPTFEMIPRYVAGLGADLVEVDAAPEGLVQRLLAATDDDTAFVAIVSPNNPSGEVVEASAFLEVADALPHVLVLADLAYIEFADHDPTAELLTRPNIVIIRTLSKAWGLAGLRLGYALGDPAVIARLRAAGGPYAVSGPSAAIGAAWVKAGAATTDAFIAQVRTEVRALTERLRTDGWQVFDSQANFVTLQADNAQAFAGALLQQGVRVRAWPNDPQRDRLVRITCPGDADDFATLLAALDHTPAPA